MPIKDQQTTRNGAMIAVRDLRKAIGAEEILRGVNLDVAVGETLAIIGRSGGGKSVLLKHLIGLMQPDAGEIWVAGKNITGMRERQLTSIRQKVGILFQSGALFDSMTVEENIAFPLREAGMRDVKAMRARVDEVLELVELQGENSKMPESLSGGMRKRVGLARAIVYRPEIVLYDEPTTGLDPIVADSIDQLIVRVRDRLKVTTVVVTHDMRSARRVGQRILMLHEGKIYVEGTPEEIFGSQDPIVYNFVNGISEKGRVLT